MLRTASEKTSEGINRKALSCLLTSTMLLMILPVFAGDKEKDEDTHFVLLLMTRKVVDQILNGKTKMGTDATAAAGPGATAASASDAEILTYGKAEGLFAGVSLGGATVEPDNNANHRLYGKTLTATNIVRENGVQPTTGGKSLVAVLDSKLTKHNN